MNKKDNGGSAFPYEREATYQGVACGKDFEHGMTLRDYFAAKALPMAAADDKIYGTTLECAKAAGLNPPQAFAKMAYEIADAMIAERNK